MIRPIGTCEHLWSAWSSANEDDPYRAVHQWCAPGVQIRRCELCRGYQLAADEEGKREREEAAMAETLHPARRDV